MLKMATIVKYTLEQGTTNYTCIKEKMVHDFPYVNVKLLKM